MADNQGTATIVAQVPQNLTAGAVLLFQAMVIRPGAVGDTSPAVEGVVQ
ncbi:MAG: hypothetical protein ABMB14_21480 [Myxococcota bacterium]